MDRSWESEIIVKTPGYFDICMWKQALPILALWPCWTAVPVPSETVGRDLKSYLSIVLGGRPSIFTLSVTESRDITGFLFVLFLSFFFLERI